MSRIAVIVVAGGQGTRMGTEVPKQFLLLDGVPVLFHTLQVRLLSKRNSLFRKNWIFVVPGMPCRQTSVQSSII